MHVFTIEPHPTCKGKVLAITPKPDSWRCDTDTERAFYAIGGTHWRGYQGQGAAFTLSPAQVRDVDLILRAGYLSSCTPDRYNGRVEAEEMLFWHPDRPDEDLTRAEVLALILPPPRCRRTLEMSFA